MHFGEICYKGFAYIRQAINEPDPEKFEEINDKLIKYEEITDNIEFEIASYLNEVSKGEISTATNLRIKSIYRIIGEMESLGDSGEAIGRMLQRRIDHEKTFDAEQMKKMNRMMDCLSVAYDAMVENLGNPVLKDIRNASFICVGPPIMIKFVVKAILELGVKEEQIWVSNERKMCCGLGKCGHCKVGSTYICLDGPVFNYTEGKNLMD